MSKKLQKLRKRKLWLLHELEAVLLELCLERSRQVSMVQGATSGLAMAQGTPAPKRKKINSEPESSPPFHYKHMRLAESDSDKYDETV